ncbi:MAG: hypothetical protein Q9193_005143 [Seirophora villosa]
MARSRSARLRAAMQGHTTSDATDWQWLAADREAPPPQRLRDTSSTVSRNGRVRIQEACDNCHHFKRKCCPVLKVDGTGAMQACQYCQEMNRDCTYQRFSWSQMRDERRKASQIVRLNARDACDRCRKSRRRCNPVFGVDGTRTGCEYCRRMERHCDKAEANVVSEDVTQEQGIPACLLKPHLHGIRPNAKVDLQLYRPDQPSPTSLFENLTPRVGVRYHSAPMINFGAPVGDFYNPPFIQMPEPVRHDAIDESMWLGAEAPTQDPMYFHFGHEPFDLDLGGKIFNDSQNMAPWMEPAVPGPGQENVPHDQQEGGFQCELEDSMAGTGDVFEVRGSEQHQAVDITTERATDWSNPLYGRFHCSNDHCDMGAEKGTTPCLSEANLSSTYRGSPGLEDGIHPDSLSILPSLEAWQFAQWQIETKNAQELDEILGSLDTSKCSVSEQTIHVHE